MNDKRLFQLMHKFGKLTSCDSEKPHTIDKMFVNELKDLLEVE